MVQYVITPWRTQAELLQVRSQLYPQSTALATSSARLEGSADEGQQKEAIARVSVWVQRGNCPHLVESTAILISAFLNDGRGNEAYCVRAVYAAAFCRFVTGLLDCHQDKRYKLSMYTIAKNIGLPATFVELRHQATHEELPSLSKLRTVSRKALSWIWDYYWVHLAPESAQRQDLPDDCEVFLRRFIEETDNHLSLRVEQSLSNWPRDHIIAILNEIQDTNQDVGILLRASQLHSKILEVDFKQSPAISVEEVKTELEVMELNLKIPEIVNDTAESEAHTNGWSLWKGAWIPKPIGMV
ncbi:cell morphogenesis protein Las1-like protein [Blumeria hordei DH14]|uniref:Cell morphogenesis protein Las1-like protein n=1 Tax=Blumeria graminis f. sp. hordei (strain DH14) TaxID=546991 RepID=N1J6B1_BLUG1|nr:cell morphogenesis protein Las1-like protein [Blumeria hordei DH14]